LIKYENQDMQDYFFTDFMAEVEYKDKTVFVDLNYFGETLAATITGEGVRFRKTSSVNGEIITQFQNGPLLVIYTRLNRTANG